MRTSKLFIAALLILTLSSLTMGDVFGQNRERIAVLPLSGVADDHGVKLAVENFLIDLFVAMRKFDIVERAQLEKILAEQQLSLAGAVSDSSAVTVGKLVGATYLVIGTISEAAIVEAQDLNGNKVYKGKVTANIRVVSSETASIIGSLTEFDFSHGTLAGGEAQPSEQLVSMAAKNLVMNTMKPKLWNLFPLEGYVIQIQNQKSDEMEALIDLGSDNGIVKGDKFLVFRQNESIKHPVTGQIIPGKTQELGEAEVKSVDAAVSTVKIKAKVPIQVGDRVKSKEKKKSFWKTL